MSQYHTVLLAVDLSHETDQIAAKARAIASSDQAALHLVHAIEPLSFSYGGDIPMDFSAVQQEIQQHTEEQMQQLGQRLNIPVDRQHLVLGRTEHEIHRLAEEINADLIVVGSHARHGLALLLGSTANGVLHGASCDVLAVRVRDND